MRSKPVFITIYLTLFYPAKNAVISSNFLVWKFLETAFPQNFHTRKLDEITVFYAVLLIHTMIVAILNSLSDVGFIFGVGPPFLRCNNDICNYCQITLYFIRSATYNRSSLFLRI